LQQIIVGFESTAKHSTSWVIKSPIYHSNDNKSTGKGSDKYTRPTDQKTFFMIHRKNLYGRYKLLLR
jgi:hypothetical protein